MFPKQLCNWPSQVSSGLSNTLRFKFKKAHEAVKVLIFHLETLVFVKHVPFSIGNTYIWKAGTPVLHLNHRCLTIHLTHFLRCSQNRYGLNVKRLSQGRLGGQIVDFPEETF